MNPVKVPTVSVIIPVLRETQLLDSLLDHLFEIADGEPIEPIIVDGSPDGETIRGISRKDVHILAAPTGRARQMNAGAATAVGGIFLFLHADTRLPSGAFRCIGEILSDGHYVAGAFDLRYRSDRPSMRFIARAACLRSRLTRIPYGDQAHFFRRDYFRKIHGFADIPFLEDVEIMRRVKQRGDRIFILPEPVITSARRQEKEGIVYCTLRNWAVVALYSMGMSPKRLARFYYKKH